jgi:predicted lipoprotein with Yx(FWY)xxD motif
MRRRTVSLLFIVPVATASITLQACDASESTPTTSPAVVVDLDGFTLYRFERKPVPVPERSTDPRVDPATERRLLDCDAGTPADWPVVVYRGDGALPGIDPRQAGFLKRPDGTRQLAIKGCPAYRYAGDRAPGETAGDGRDSEWFAIRWQVTAR